MYLFNVKKSRAGDSRTNPSADLYLPTSYLYLHRVGGHKELGDTKTGAATVAHTYRLGGNANQPDGHCDKPKERTDIALAINSKIAEKPGPGPGEPQSASSK